MQEGLRRKLSYGPHTELAQFGGEPSHPLCPEPEPPGMFSLDVILFISLFLTFLSHRYASSVFSFFSFFFLTFDLALLTAVNKKFAELWEGCGAGQERRREEKRGKSMFCRAKTTKCRGQGRDSLAVGNLTHGTQCRALCVHSGPLYRTHIKKYSHSHIQPGWPTRRENRAFLRITSQLMNLCRLTPLEGEMAFVCVEEETHHMERRGARAFPAFLGFFFSTSSGSALLQALLLLLLLLLLLWRS